MAAKVLKSEKGKKRKTNVYLADSYAFHPEHLLEN